MAFLAGVDAATISRIERGKVEPERATVVKLARALGLSVSRLRSMLEQGAGAEGAQV
jgi:transcriptional regulator with XRE-family HTH domain